MARRNSKDNAKRASRPTRRQKRDARFQLVDNIIQEDFAEPQKKKIIEIKPRNDAQYDYLEALRDEQNHIIFAMGPAGTGKTMLATEYAIEQLQLGTIKKILLTRPMVSVDEDIGTLPGGVLEKVAPWVIPIMDVFKEHFSVRQVELMLKDGTIEIAPLALMRGRTLKSAICLCDEMQNATPNQMKMVLTRIGEGSRMIVTGDLAQHDRGFESNGLKDFVARLQMSGSDCIEVCEFNAGDVERHPVVADVLRIYGEE